MAQKVIIAFSTDPDETGKTVTVSDEQAQIMVREGRARYASEEPTGGKTRKNAKQTDTTES